MKRYSIPRDARVASRYRIILPIGEGGFGTVFEAEHVVTGRRCALKVMRPHAAASSDARARFLRESQLATRICCEFIVEVLDAGVDERSGLPFIAMELLHGEDLAQKIARRRACSPGETLLYLSHLAAALTHAHQRGIVHRDLKPSNLFLTRRDDGSPLVKVLDFGIAKLLSDDGSETTTALGTPLYMAPEQFRGERATAAVDIYALGMIAFRLLVGRHYFALEQDQSANNYALSALLINGVPEPASARAARYGAHCGAGFDAWFAVAAAPTPDERFRSAAEAVRALAAALEVGNMELLPAGPGDDRDPGEDSSWQTRSLSPQLAPAPRELPSPVSPSAVPARRTTGRRLRSAAVIVATLGALVIDSGGNVVTSAAPPQLTPPLAEPESHLAPGATPSASIAPNEQPPPRRALREPPAAQPTEAVAPALLLSRHGGSAAEASAKPPSNADELAHEDLWTRE